MAGPAGTSGVPQKPVAVIRSDGSAANDDTRSAPTPTLLLVQSASFTNGENDVSYNYPAMPYGTPVEPQPEPVEDVAMGLATALLAVIGGVVLTVVLWRIGFIAGVSSFVIAGGSIALYSRAAGSVPRKGLIPLVAMILVGVVASFFAAVASDLWQVYDQIAIARPAGSRTRFIMDNIFNGDVLSLYGKDIFMFALFAVLGVFGSMRRLAAANAVR